jgi:Dual OB-containing domain
MVEKIIYVLAKSVKYHPNNCVAGIELIPNQTDADYKVGSWIRPVSHHGHGELSPEERRVSEYREVRLQNIVKIPLRLPTREISQPENWLLDGKIWTDLSRKIPQPPLFDLVERPADLWMSIETPNQTDRITQAEVSRRKPRQSLYLIRPKSLTCHAWREYNPVRKQQQLQRRADFEYGQHKYSLSITDPLYWDKHFDPVPQLGEPERVITYPEQQIPILCVSLTPAYNGSHYKIVATIFEV